MLSPLRGHIGACHSLLGTQERQPYWTNPRILGDSQSARSATVSQLQHPRQFSAAGECMEYVLTGFHQATSSIRQYAFQRIAADRTRTEFTVGVDLDLVRKYQISLQELPLLCRHFLEGQPPAEEAEAVHTLTFPEEDMLGYANRRAAEQSEAKKKKAHRMPPSNGGEAWRSPKPNGVR